MRYSTIKVNDIANGPGVRISFWVQGCPFHCENCHNKDTWDPSQGLEFTEEIKSSLINYFTDNDVKRNLSILGGEPLAEYNLEMVEYVIKLARECGIKDIWLWTGFTIEELNLTQLSVVQQVDTIIDGRFRQDLYSPTLKYRGSSNQRIFNIKEGELYECTN